MYRPAAVRRPNLSLTRRATQSSVWTPQTAIAAAQSATRMVRILGISDDMVGAGLVRPLTRPGSNVTGVSILSTELNSKRLELLTEAFKDARRIAVLADPRIMTPMHVKML